MQCFKQVHKFVEPSTTKKLKWYCLCKMHIFLVINFFIRLYFCIIYCYTYMDTTIAGNSYRFDLKGNIQLLIKYPLQSQISCAIMFGTKWMIAFNLWTHKNNALMQWNIKYRRPSRPFIILETATATNNILLRSKQCNPILS